MSISMDYSIVLVNLHYGVPVALLSLIFIRTGVNLFLRLMDRIQSEGWIEGDDYFHPPPARDAVVGADATQGDEITPVVTKVIGLRRNLVVGLFYAVASCYTLSGAVQVISTLIANSSSIPRDIVAYNAGGLLAYSIVVISMVVEEAKSGKACGWSRFFPRFITMIGLLGEIACLSVSILSLQSSTLSVDSILQIGLLSLRVMILSLLFLSQTQLLSSVTFVANPVDASPSPNNYGSTTTRTLLRSSRPPSSRPQDPKSLSLLTLFTRIRILAPYLWPSESVSLQILAIVCVSLMLVRRVVNVLVPIFFGNIIQDLVVKRSPFVSISLYVLVSFLSDSNDMLRRWLWLPLDQFSERSMSIRSYECLLNLSLAYHTKRKTGEMLRILDRSDAINNFFQTLIFTFLPIVIDLPIAFLYLSLKYGSAIVATVSVVAVVFVSTSVILAESRTKLYRSLRDEDQYMRAIKTDVLLQFEAVKIFTAESYESDRLRNALRVYQKGYWNVYSSWNSLSLIQDSISAFGLLVCSFILANRVVKGEMQVGEFVTFTSYLGQLYRPLNSIAGLYRTVMSNLVDTEQLMELLSQEMEIVDRPGASELLMEEPSKASIEFDNVRFSYDGIKDTINGVSFKVEAGSSVALVGSSGSGKSTIVRLLYRFYEPQSGSIKIGGTDIQDYTQISVRSNIGLVPQSAALFNETIRFNISYGDRFSSQEEIEDAARSAAIHDRILTFPDGYNTRVGERGQRLSGGEQQRVAIARVILKNAPILLLDEATSALDTSNERLIQRKLRELSVNRTTISIAHRLSTIVDSDMIHVLSDGKIIESGSHLDLLARAGAYAELWRAQIEDGTEIVASSGTPPVVTSLI